MNFKHTEGCYPPLYMRVDIKAGRVLAGALGSEFYSAYIVLSDPVNIGIERQITQAWRVDSAE